MDNIKLWINNKVSSYLTERFDGASFIYNPEELDIPFPFPYEHQKIEFGIKDKNGNLLLIRLTNMDQTTTNKPYNQFFWYFISVDIITHVKSIFSAAGFTPLFHPRSVFYFGNFSVEIEKRFIDDIRYIVLSIIHEQVNLPLPFGHPPFILYLNGNAVD